MLRLFPEPSATFPVEQTYLHLDLPQEGEAGRPYTMINAVGTLDGRGAVGGKSTPVGSDVDHCLMRNIRANVDAVLVGAGTLRSENAALTVDAPLAKLRRARGQKEQPLPIILSGSGDLPTDRRIFRESGSEVLIFAGADADRKNLAALSGFSTVITAKESRLPAPEKVLETLAGEFGVRRLLVEGGPSINRSFLEARLVDELFLTLAPRIVGGNQPSLVAGGPLSQYPTSSLPTLVSTFLHPSVSELYLRYQLGARPCSVASFR